MRRKRVPNKEGQDQSEAVHHGTEEAYNWKKTIQAYEEATPGVTIELVQLSEKGIRRRRSRSSTWRRHPRPRWTF